MTKWIICPNSPLHVLFLTSAHVAQTWVVDGRGDFEDVASTDDTTSAPSHDNQWLCAEPGCTGVGIDSRKLYTGKFYDFDATLDIVNTLQWCMSHGYFPEGIIHMVSADKARMGWLHIVAMFKDMREHESNDPKGLVAYPPNASKEAIKALFDLRIAAMSPDYPGNGKGFNP